MSPEVQYAGPYIDERLEYVGITRLRALNVAKLRELDKVFVIQDNDKPLAVLISYDQFLAMQETLRAAASILKLDDVLGGHQCR